MASQRGRKKHSSSSIDMVMESPNDRALQAIVAEYERKIATLTAQLGEKVEQNITLQQQADIDLRLILDLQEAQFPHSSSLAPGPDLTPQENLKLLALLEEQKSLASEYQRRTESMAVGLNMMAVENLQLRAALDEKEGKKGTAPPPVIDPGANSILCYINSSKSFCLLLFLD